MAHDLVRIGGPCQRRSRMPRLPARFRPLLRHNDFGAGFTNGESDDGGRDEF
jgi:hypothetical protein